MDILEKIPPIFFQFLIVMIFSLLIGIEQRRHQEEKEGDRRPFGTDRTFAFIGVIGFVFYIIDRENLVLFITGAILLSVFFGIFYFKKIQEHNSFGITTILVGLITYSLGPLLLTQSEWLTILIFVSVLILVESKPYFIKFADKLSNHEFITLGKFLIIAGVVLPLLPTTPISESIDISTYRIWLSLVVVSGISYASYLLKKFVFKKSGILVSGIFGGLYSSTATTVVLSRKSKENKTGNSSFAAGIILASAMMYFRIFILLIIFNSGLAMFMLPYFAIMFFVSVAAGVIVYLFSKKVNNSEVEEVIEKNPLELKIALIFSALFLFFSFITNYTLDNFGESGLNILSYIVGFTDIDPFLLNLFQGQYNIGEMAIALATLQAIISNNILKICYTLFLAEKKTKQIVLAGLGMITIINLVLLFFV